MNLNVMGRYIVKLLYKNKALNDAVRFMGELIKESQIKFASRFNNPTLFVEGGLLLY